MSGFGFFPSERGRGSTSPPPGYGSATVHLGDAVETVFCSVAIWNIHEYADHWRHGASKCLRDRQPFLFCTDLSDQNASVFAAFPEGDGYSFEEWVIPRRAFTVSGREILLASQDDMARSGGDASSWRVDETAIADFVKAN